MRYDEMQRIYPQIEELFAQVAEQIRAGQTAAGVKQLLGLCVGAEIHKRHQQAVTSKLARFAQLVEQNNACARQNHIAGETALSPPCLYCGSIETTGGRCAWCHVS